MDNALTPNKIQRLIHIAEDKSFNISRRIMKEEEMKRVPAQQAHMSKSTATYETSSGILDLDRLEGFGESGLSTESLSRSTTFNPGEMTGRSTGTEDISSHSMPLGRHSLAIDNITSQMNQQTNEIQDIMRHSIATEFSFHSKRDLTADEASLVIREAPLPIQQTTQTFFPDSVASSDQSMGTYFQNRCPEFARMLGKTDSPDRSAFNTMPSITEVSTTTPFEHTPAQLPSKFTLDETLDSVPVRQPRLEIPQQKLNINKSFLSSTEKNDTYNIQDYSIHKVPEIQKTTNPNQKFTSSKPTDVLIRNLQASMKLVSEETEGSVENSLSISKIADYLGKESNVSVTGMLQLNRQKAGKKQPLSELHMNLQEKKEVEVTNLRDTRSLNTASSAGTMSTVISLNKLKVPQEIPSDDLCRDDDEMTKKRSTKSKSPSSKSHSTLSTVHENYVSFKSGDSPLRNSKGDPNHTRIPSPNVEYKELDKSVDWREVLQQKRLRQHRFKEQWADISATTASGFVGSSCTVTITLTTLTDSWLTAKLQFINLPNEGKDLTIELPRQPLLLSPLKCEKFTFTITSYIEMKTNLTFTLHFKDASIDSDVEQMGEINVDIKMPVIQAMSCNELDKVTFPPVQEKSSLVKSFVVISDCPVDLQLELFIVEGDLFAIKSVQEIKKGDVNKVLTDRQGLLDDGQGKAKSKGMKQLCILSSGNAIKVTIRFNAPKLTEMQTKESIVTFNGALNVNLFGVNAVLKKVDLVGIVGTVNLVAYMSTNKLHLTKEQTNLTLSNTGSIPGVWAVKVACSMEDCPFKVAPNKFDIRPGAMRKLALMYSGPDDSFCEASLILEDLTTGQKTPIEITGGTDKPKTFPIRTNHNIMSFVRPERKELSLKNSTNKKVQIRCYTAGEGFNLDLPGERGVYCLTFGPNECRSVSVMFNPVTNSPQAAMLHLVCENNNELSRKVKLYGCVSGECLRWRGLVTHGETALVRAVSSAPIALHLYNKNNVPAFLCARVHFNIQYTSISSTAVLSGAQCIVPPRSTHTVTLQVQWSRVCARARAAHTAALATLTVLTGADVTRHRILRVLRDDKTGVLDTSHLDDRLKVLAGHFEGEDPNMANMLADFHETKASLNELIGGIHELTAQIVLPHDFADEHTILVTDDTIVEHHTLCD